MSARNIRTSAVISLGHANLTGTRLADSPDRGEAEEGALFVSAADGFPEGDSFDTVFRNGEDTLFLAGISPKEAVNEANRAFEFYNAWEISLLDCVARNLPLQSLLDRAHNVFRRPMFIKGNSSWVFAITSGYDPSVHPDWANLEQSVQTRAPDFNAVKAVSLDPDFQAVFSHKYPDIVRSPFYGGMVLRTNVWLEDKRVCEVVALENGNPFNPGDTHLMYAFSRVLELYINANKALYATISGLSGFFSSLLEKGECTPENVKAIQHATRWSDGDEFILFCIETKTRQESPILGVLRDKLETLPLSGSTFIYSNRIVSILNLTQEGGYHAVLNRMREAIPADAFVWGASHEFSGLERFISFYRQALLVLEAAVRRNLNSLTMHEAAYGFLAEWLGSIPEAPYAVHPDLYRLREHDRRNDTRYMQTLFEFLLCGGNYTDTANRLGLHRNSLIYRMSKIREIVAWPLDDAENKKLLLTSFLLLGGDRNK